MSDPTGTIESALHENRRFPPPEMFQRQARVQSMEQYRQLWDRSIRDPEAFWAEQARELHWFKQPDRVLEWDEPFAHWFGGGQINASYNCLDRVIAAGKGDRTAIVFEGEPVVDEGHDPTPAEVRRMSYSELRDEVCRFANALKALGVRKGDVVTIYMPMVPEAVVAMLACARIGAPHSVIFGGFSAQAIADRVADARSRFLVTADGGWRRGKVVELKRNVDEALAMPGGAGVEKVILLRRVGHDVPMTPGRDVWWHDAVAGQPADCPAEPMDSEDLLFVLYTSGSTGKPKGIIHTTAGYLLHCHITSKYVFDLKDEDLYWCTADIGWVTGHSYTVYGPLSMGATVMMYEGAPNYPDFARFWQVVERHKVTVFYTAPTAIRAFMRAGRELPDACDLSSLQLLGTVGEPINPEAWVWYNDVVGHNACPIVDTWWQTETGGILISPLPGATALKPGSATLPFFGVQPAIVDAAGNILEGECEGNLVLLDSWPGQMRTVYGDDQRFFDTYFSTYPGMYFTGDGARRDADGYYWITGRVDDVINVSGHRIGTAEVESALVSHPKVAEAAVVGFPHDVKGQGIYAYVTLVAGEVESDELLKELVAHVRREIGPIASPDFLQWAPGLPKTRSGKIMRRILRKIAENAPDQLGDTSTLADPSVVDSLVRNRRPS